MSMEGILANTLSHEQSLREGATQQLETAAAENYPLYAHTLSRALANESSPSHIRQAAGLALKNVTSARDEQRQRALERKWIALPDDLKAQIKTSILETLASDDLGAGTTAGQVIAAAAAIEIPRGEWPNLLARLLENVQSSSAKNEKLCSIQTIGYICESIDAAVLETQSNQILTALIAGANKTEPDDEVRLVAIKSFITTLEFAKKHFEQESERNYIMQVICEATQATNDSIAAKAFQCLSQIMQLYYDHMAFYMEKALFNLTVVGMKNSDPDVAMQAIEFWSTVCDEEIDIELDTAEALEFGETPQRTSANFAKKANFEVLPVLLWLLTKQEEDVDDDEWTVAMAAATCLSLLAQSVKDDIVSPIVPFIEGHIRSEDWRYREGAVMAFGSILQGPNEQSIQVLVTSALPVLIEMMKDPITHVKDSVAWTLGRVCDLASQCINPDDNLPSLMAALLSGLDDSPKITTNCCWSLMNLAAKMEPEDRQNDAYPLGEYFDGIMTALIRVSERPTNEANSRTSAYEAISAMISGCGDGSIPTVVSVCSIIMDRFETALNAQANLIGVDQVMAHSELQSNLCSVFTTIERRLDKKTIVPMADRMMTLLLELLNRSAKQSTVIEDAFLAVGALSAVLERDFSRYLDSFTPFLHAALQNHEEYQLCQIAIGLVGDICRALGELAAPYCNDYMGALLHNVQSTAVNSSVKPVILSCFGDIALAIEGKFDLYLEVTMTILKQASQFIPLMDESESGQYLDGVLEAYVGIVQGLKAGNKAQLLLPYVEGIFGFLGTIYKDYTKTDSMMRSMIGLLGDLTESFPRGEINAMVQAPWITSCLKDGRMIKHYSAATKETARWAKEVIKRAA